jgi:hypothetical protein
MDTIDTNEALRKIDEIQKVIEGSNQALISGERLMAFAVMMPFIYFSGAPLEDFISRSISPSRQIIELVSIAVYCALIWMVYRLLPFKQPDKSQMNPLLRKAFSVSRPLLVGVFGLIFAFQAAGGEYFIVPVIFVLLGVLYNLWAPFSVPAIRYIGWSYIAFGIVGVYLTQFHIPHIDKYFIAFVDAGTFTTGFFVIKGKKQHG